MNHSASEQSTAAAELTIEQIRTAIFDVSDRIEIYQRGLRRPDDLSVSEGDAALAELDALRDHREQLLLLAGEQAKRLARNAVAGAGVTAGPDGAIL